jgi:hypothetical protein
MAVSLFMGCSTHWPPLHPRKYSWYSFLLEAKLTQGHSAARWIMSMKNSNYTIGNRTRNLLASSTVPQPTAPLRTPIHAEIQSNILGLAYWGIFLFNPSAPSSIRGIDPRFFTCCRPLYVV